MSLLKRFFGGVQKDKIEKEYNIGDMSRTTQIKFIEELIANLQGESISFDKFVQLLSSDWSGNPRKFHTVSHYYIEYLSTNSLKYKQYYHNRKVEKPYGEAFCSEYLEECFVQIHDELVVRDGQIKLMRKYTRKSSPSAFKEEEKEIVDYIKQEHFDKGEIKKVLLDKNKLSVVFEKKMSYSRIGVLVFDLI